MKWKSKIESKLKSKNVKNKGPKGTTNEKERGKQISKQKKSLLFLSQIKNSKKRKYEQNASRGLIRHTKKRKERQKMNQKSKMERKLMSKNVKNRGRKETTEKKE